MARQLTGLAPSPVANGDDARAALVNFDLQSAPSAPQPDPAPGANAPVSEKQLSVQALRALDAAQKAATTGDWKVFAQQSALARQLLQELVARRQ